MIMGEGGGKTNKKYVVSKVDGTIRDVKLICRRKITIKL